ncbi:vitamin B12 dependent-methionine synthase activation domain-containing protein [Chloroflexota bacterium]
MQLLENKLQTGLDKQQVLKNIGYADECEPSVRIDSLVNDYIDNYHHLIDSSASCIVKRIESVEGNITDIEDSISLNSSAISRLMEHCREVAIFTLTIGNRLEDMVGYLAEKGHVLQATVLDAIGSGAVETLAASVEENVKQEAGSNGMVISQRFSPGYCDWDVSQQEMVFRAMGENTAGVHLTGEYLMLPQKSISGIIGIGSAEKEIESYTPCTNCRTVDCPGRRV